MHTTKGCGPVEMYKKHVVLSSTSKWSERLTYRTYRTCVRACVCLSVCLSVCAQRTSQLD